MKVVAIFLLLLAFPFSQAGNDTASQNEVGTVGESSSQDPLDVIAQQDFHNETVSSVPKSNQKSDVLATYILYGIIGGLFVIACIVAIAMEVEMNRRVIQFYDEKPMLFRPYYQPSAV